jgi:hypothetical protein
MNKWLRRGVNLTLFCLAFNSLEHFCHKETDGFSLSRIQFNEEKPETASADPSILPLLNQPYRYFGRGNQSYVFISEDGQYILKFFKYVHHAAPVWTAKVPLLNKFKPFSLRKIKKIAWKRNRDFQGYRLAFEQFREETGLLCIHLHASEKEYPVISIRDKFNIAHSLDLNQTPFVLQKRAVPAYTQFSSWIKNGEIEKARQGIDRLFHLCRQRLAKNIEDDDTNFYSNCGFIGETPILIDPGHFIANPSLSPEAELKSVTLQLKKWFARNHPPLVPYVESCALSH